METTTVSKKHEHIKGWGVDANPQNEPTYPMKNYTGDDHKRLNYTKPPKQHGQVEVLKSNERPSISAVYGTSTPPSGLSGAIRRYAFKYSESSYGHWLPLLIADRINVWEGIIADLRRGRIPNILGELGIRSEWRYNKKGLAKKVLVAAAVSTAVYLIFFRKKQKVKTGKAVEV
jgi:hypothetical protein